MGHHRELKLRVGLNAIGPLLVDEATAQHDIHHFTQSFYGFVTDF